METQMACRAAPNVKEGCARPPRKHTRPIRTNHTQTVAVVPQWTQNLFHWKVEKRVSQQL